MHRSKFNLCTKLNEKKKKLWVSNIARNKIKMESLTFARNGGDKENELFSLKVINRHKHKYKERERESSTNEGLDMSHHFKGSGL